MRQLRHVDNAHARAQAGGLADVDHVAADVTHDVHARALGECPHLLEDGVKLRVLQSCLGHTSPRTTSLYTHLTTRVQDEAYVLINALAKRTIPPLHDADSDEPTP